MYLRKIPCYYLPDYKIYIIIALAILAVYNSLMGSGLNALYGVILAVFIAGFIDGIIIKFRTKLWSFPSGAIISAMILSLIINPGDFKTISYVVVVSLILKHLIKPNFRNIFNPAALSIVVSSIFLPVSSVWWGSAGYLTIILSLILVYLIKRIDLALSFFISYTLLAIFKNFLTGSEISFSFLSGPIVFFAFFMVIEPVTSPTKRKSRIIFGASTAILAFLLSFINPLFYNSFFLYLSLLFMNLMSRILPRDVLG